jgi:ribosome-associated translation inhibitor RaiA
MAVCTADVRQSHTRNKESTLGDTNMTPTSLGRDLSTEKDVNHRGALPDRVPRPVKRMNGRTDTSRTPAHVRVIGVELDDDDQDLVRRKLGMKLGKFAPSIERVSVRVTDTNGPRGGVDQVCNVKVVLSGLPSVVIERRDAVLHAAIDLALRATEQAVRRSVRRRRMKPLRGRNSSLPRPDLSTADGAPFPFESDVSF